MQKNFPSFFRKVFFFHRPCANLLDFSSSLICLSESAFSQRSRSLPTLKVAPRSAAGPGPRRSTRPRSRLEATRSVYNMLTFHLTRPGSPGTDLNSGPVARERGAATTRPFHSGRAAGGAAGGATAPIAALMAEPRGSTAPAQNATQESAPAPRAPLLQLC